MSMYLLVNIIKCYFNHLSRLLSASLPQVKFFYCAYFVVIHSISQPLVHELVLVHDNVFFWQHQLKTPNSLLGSGNVFLVHGWVQVKKKL